MSLKPGVRVTTAIGFPYSVFGMSGRSTVFFVGMRARLLADQHQFPHQATHFETAYLLTMFLHHRYDTAAASSASA